MPPVVDHLIDNKVLAASAQRKKELQLFEQVQRLQERLEEVTLANNEEVAITLDEALSSIESNDSADGDFDVILKVKPQKVEQITSQIIDGKKCIIIPMDDDELANVNGITNLL